ncbi:MAG: hypothetical protein V4582_01570 [Pseudomonadota bacterium]
MKPSPLARLFCSAALGAILGASAPCALAAPKQMPTAAKPLAAACKTRGPMREVQANEKIGHRYLMLMMFAKGTGAQYFGGASYAEEGCLADIDVAVDAKSGAQTKSASKQQLYIAVCPDDCNDLHLAPSAPAASAPNVASAPSVASASADAPAPAGAAALAKSLNDGSDPLGPHAWGILSAADPIKPNGIPDGKIEVWQVAVRDACQAYALYKFHAGAEQVLGRAMAKGDFLGQILVGMPVPGAGGQSQSCD